MRWSRKVFLILVMLTIVFATTSVHELAHIGLALVTGIRVAGVTWGQWFLGPTVLLEADHSSFQLTMVLYGGGLVAGALLLLIYYVWGSTAPVDRSLTSTGVLIAPAQATDGE